MTMPISDAVRYRQTEVICHFVRTALYLAVVTSVATM